MKTQSSAILPAQVTPEGSLCCYVGRDGARTATIVAGNSTISLNIYTGKIFRTTRRRDGVMTWRLFGTYGGTRTGVNVSPKFHQELQTSAPHEWRECRHNLICD
jgi:hypothetical protein